MSIKKEQPKINFVQNEHDVLSYWSKHQVFQKLKEKNSNGPKWSFLDGPITANNPMGVHHAWGRSLKDLYQRYKAMNGFNLRYQNGFDCQGLWVEVEVEKELGIKSKKEVEELGIEKFVQLCKDRVTKFAKVQTEQSIRLGYWMDWDNSYFTMSEENNYAIWSFLKKLFNEGKIYKGSDVVPWSGRSGTSYSQMEIIEGRKLTVHKAVFVKFPLLNKNNESLLIWTTTPWTLSSNIAVAVNTKLKYLKIKTSDSQIYYLAKENLKYQRLGKEFSEKKNWVDGIPKLKTLDQIFKERGGYEIIDEIDGSQLVGEKYSSPFDYIEAQQAKGGFPLDPQATNNKSAIDCHLVVDGGKDSEGNDMVVEGEGTGFVHLASGCGSIDNKLCKQFDFVSISPIDNQANFIEGFDFMSGKSVIDKEVIQQIINDLKERKFLVYAEDYPHIYPHCWRSGEELVFKQVDEWYINMDWRNQIKKIVDDINWIPSWGQDREHDWLDNMGDWMISKKRFWGLALPIWTFEDGSFYVVGSKKELEELAVEGWDQFKGKTPHRPWIDEVKIKHPQTGLIGTRIPDVGNPWLDAGIVPFSTMGYFSDKDYWKEWFPADFITECFPGQFRNWFYSLLAMSAFLENKAPFKTLLGHALVKDEKGDEMHKSAGNAIWFDDAAEEMGVDVMRWLYARQPVENNLLFGYEKADEVRKKLIGFWNVYSFYCTYAKLDNFKPSEEWLQKDQLSLLDEWILSKLHLLIDEAKQDFENFNVDKFLKKFEIFLDELSNWYVRQNRRRFWKSENDSDKMIAFQTLYHVLVHLVKILSPILPFVTERMFLNLTSQDPEENKTSVHLCSFPESDSRLINSQLVDKMEILKVIIENGRAVRKKANIKIRQPLSSLKIFTRNQDIHSFIIEQKQLILDELNIKEIILEKDVENMGVFSIKPNFKSLSQKFGDKMSEIIKNVNSLDSNIVVQKYFDGEASFESENELSFEDIIIDIQNSESEVAFFSKDNVVSLNIDIDEELMHEGLVRDLIRHVQTMRKDAELNVEDRIVIGSKFSKLFNDALSKNKEYFMNETLCLEIVENLEKFTYNSSFTLENEKFEIFIRKAD